MRCPSFLIATHKDCHDSILLWLMANLKRAMTPERLRKRANNLFLPKTITYLQHIAAMSRPGVETQWSETETILWGYETETTVKFRKTCLETSNFDICLSVVSLFRKSRGQLKGFQRAGKAIAPSLLLLMPQPIIKFESANFDEN